MSAYATIDYVVDGPAALVTLDRPDRLNAFTPTMQRELCDALDRVDADDDVRALIVTGRGRAFCAGADLAAGEATFDADVAGGAEATEARSGTDPMRDLGGLLTLRIFECTKPVIAAINGPAVGVGATMTLPMDIRLAAEDARFGFVFAARGLVPEAASGWFLPRVVGISRAMEWCATARVFPATDALEAGLVRSLHPAEELLDVAHELAEEIAANASPVSVAVTRQLLWRMLGAAHPMEAHKVDSRAIQALGRGADAREGVMAFLEKREARWVLRPSRDLPDFYPWWQDPPFE